ncbi:MAG: hypothetical protein ABSA42_19405 [Terracidiphilus sp.]|jgi:photosystem II stability/assembly factor-like uncharacterized protein
MRRKVWLFAVVLAACGAAHAQWEMESSGTTADLRGIDNVGGGVAWASGTNGTVLRTEDGGHVWQACAVPPGAEHLDFRGVQAFDANTAIVMSSGKGDLSRLYKTTDGCHKWKLVLKNIDPDGFYDAVVFWDKQRGFLLGDRVSKILTRNEKRLLGYQANQRPDPYVMRTLKHPRLLTMSTIDGGIHWAYWGTDRGYYTEDVAVDGVLFAASNSSVFMPFQSFPYCRTSPSSATSRSWIGAGGRGGARVLIGFSNLTDVCAGPKDRWPDEQRFSWSKAIPVPMAGGTDSSGIFSLAFRQDADPTSIDKARQATTLADDHGYINGVAVGGDYTKPTETTGTAAWSVDSGSTWTAPANPPHGYRSAVAYDAATKTWITVGPNGTDISTDDGRNWRALRPDAAMHEAADADRDWNALSLPFVVGPRGRIGKLRAGALSAAGK